MALDRYTLYQHTLLKSLLNSEGMFLRYARRNNHLCITVDGAMMFAIPEHLCLLDKSAMRESSLSMLNTEFSKLKQLTVTKVVVEISRDRHLQLLLRPDGTRVFVDKKYISRLKLKKSESLNFRQKSPLDPVWVFSGDNWLGLIGPYRIADESVLKGVV